MNIYVGNLSYNTAVSELQEAFEAHGSVASCKIITDRETGRSKGFGFVEMDDDEAGRSAIEALNGAMMNGRPLRVNEARPREARPPRRDFGGGGGGYGGGGGGGYDRW